MHPSNRRSGLSLTEQTINNTTSWIGHFPGETTTVSRGQTFISEKETDLEAIEVFSNMVTDPGKVQLSIHNVDPGHKSWGPALASSTVDFVKTDTGKWVAFPLPGFHLNMGKCYGFKIESEDSLIGIGEAAGDAEHPPFNNGQEWRFMSENQEADSFSYFSLAFKVAERA